MATRGLFTTTHLAPLLAERGITLSASQIHRLVSGTPERLSLPVLAAVCDLLEVTPADLTETRAENTTARKIAGARGPTAVEVDQRRDQDERAEDEDEDEDRERRRQRGLAAGRAGDGEPRRQQVRGTAPRPTRRGSPRLTVAAPQQEHERRGR